MLNENINVTGNLTIDHLDENKVLIKRYDLKNLVVTSGKNYITSRMVGTAKPVLSHMAIGSGTTFQLLANTTLQTELARTSFDSALLAANVITYVATFFPTIGTGSITEAGMFNDATAGDMLCRTTFAPINKGIADTLIITWTIVVN